MAAVGWLTKTTKRSDDDIEYDDASVGDLFEYSKA
jgi:hypothetical protein